MVYVKSTDRDSFRSLFDKSDSVSRNVASLRASFEKQCSARSVATASTATGTSSMHESTRSLVSQNNDPPLSPPSPKSSVIVNMRPLDRLKKKVSQVIMFRRMFGGKNYDELNAGEHRADAKSMQRKETKPARSSILRKESSLRKDSCIQFRDPLEEAKEIEDLRRRDTTWGDVWDDLYYDEEALAEMRYQAHLEACGVSDEPEW